MKQRRSSTKGMKSSGQDTGGVGGRQRTRPRATGGAGYLDIYTKLEPQVQKNRARDPRIDTLKEMGLDWRWIKIAESVGFDSFIGVWKMLSDSFDDDRSYIRASIPHIKKLVRFQRNLLITNLSIQGHGVDEIRRKLLKTYDISMPESTIRTIINKPE